MKFSLKIRGNQENQGILDSAWSLLCVYILNILSVCLYCMNIISSQCLIWILLFFSEVKIINRMSTYFKDCWLDPLLSSWLEKGPDKSAKCKKCHVSFTLSNMGKRSLESHMQGKKHITKSKSASSFFQAVPVKPQNSPGGASADSVPKQAILRCDKTDKTNAEIYWTFNVVANNYSLNSCDDSRSLFTMMFPDSDIAQKYQMGKAKLAYVINFGLEPYFRNMLIYDVNTSPFFSISFDQV